MIGIINSLPTSDGVYLFRVLNLSVYLNNNGFKNIIIHKEEILKDTSILKKLSGAIVVRPMIFSELPKILLDKKISLKIIMDHDDISLPLSIPFSGNLFSLGKINDDFYKLHYQKALESHFDYSYCITSTRKLVDIFTNVLKRKVILQSNLLPFHKLIKSNVNNNSELKLLLASGTRTHTYDTYIAILQILEFLNSKKNVTLSLLGSFGAELISLLRNNSKVKIINRCSFEELPKLISQFNVLLNPLHFNIQNNCKSNIKFLHASQCGVPIVSTEVDEYKSIITHGYNGFLVKKDNSNWVEVLNEVYAKKEILSQIGLNAFLYAKKHYDLNTYVNEHLNNIIKELFYAK